MTLEEFSERYCSVCGAQRCYGVYDEVCRVGCGKLQTQFPPNLQGVTSTYIGGECVSDIIGFGHRFNDDLTIWYDDYEPLEDECHLTTILDL